MGITMRTQLAVLIIASFLAPAARAQLHPDYPPAEAMFLKIVQDARQKALQAPNDLSLDRIRASRKQHICGVLRSLSVVGWIGAVVQVTLETQYGNDPRKVGLVLVLADNIGLQTWGLTDLDQRDQTMIPERSPAYQQLAGIKKLKAPFWSKFSGAFISGASQPRGLRDLDCVIELSTTTRESLEQPRFLFRFTEFQPPIE
jgi:hypothetical protein